jgi:hypothetical protein
VLDEGDFERFVATVDPLLKAGRDVLWVLVGRTESNLPKVRKLLTKYRMCVHVFYLCYNVKQMSGYGYWKRQRGIANSKSLEVALYCYKGKSPKNQPKNRMHVDAGSCLFDSVLRNVPVLAPKHQAFVSKEVRETSLRSMQGVTQSYTNDERERLEAMHDDDDGMGLDQPNGDAQQEAILTAQRKRQLYKQPSKTDVPWFPHDNDMALLKEFCWESGTPRWVLHGTPAGGAGVLGCLEAGCSVVALCYDDHHRTHLTKILLERAVEAMVAGTAQVFKDEALLARSIELNVTPISKAASARLRPVFVVRDSDGEEEIEAKPKKKHGQKAEKKTKEPKHKAKATRKTKGAANVIDASVSDTDSSESESDDEPPAKKKSKK